MRERFVFATTNEGKMKEIRVIMEDLGVTLFSLKDAGLNVDIEENGSSFAENALIKARTIRDMTGEMVLADDSGLEIDYLNKEPGIYSARYMKDAPYTEKNRNLIERMKDARGSERSARFVCAIAAVFPDGTEIVTEGTMEGLIAEEPAGEFGFGYDPILYLPEFQATSAEITMEQKNAVSHRGKALRAMKEELKKIVRGNSMKILIVSDTHRQDLNLKAVLDKVAPIDMLIHLGDLEGSEGLIRSWVGENCRVEMVAGNNDFFSDLDREKEIRIGKYRALLTHGHYYSVSVGYEMLRSEAIARDVDIAMFGHIHRPVLDIGDKVTILNPGSLSYPRQEGRKPSYIIMELDHAGEAHYTINYLNS